MRHVRPLRLLRSYPHRCFAHRQSRKMTQPHSPSPVEEQTLQRYAEKQYSAVRIGETLNRRYQVVAKLGYGAYSTVWLARDQL